jgi:hypothetical protein
LTTLAVNTVTSPQVSTVMNLLPAPPQFTSGNLKVSAYQRAVSEAFKPPVAPIVDQWSSTCCTSYSRAGVAAGLDGLPHQRAEAENVADDAERAGEGRIFRAGRSGAADGFTTTSVTRPPSWLANARQIAVCIPGSSFKGLITSARNTFSEHPLS